MRIKITIVLLIALIFVMLVTACSEDNDATSQESSGISVQTEDSKNNENVSKEESSNTASAESSDEIRESWSETETFGNKVVIREYRNYGNDYTVASEIHKNGKLTEVSVEEYIDKIKVYCESTEYNSDGGLKTYSKDTFDETGKVIQTEQISKYEKYEVQRNSQVDADGAMCDGTIEYLSNDGKTIASGTIKRELFDGHDCNVERFNIYNNDGEAIQSEVYATYLTGAPYSYKEISDAQGNLVYYEKNSDEYVYCIGGSEGAIITALDGLDVFEEPNGTLIAEAQGTTITKIGDKYNTENVISKVESIIQKRAECETRFVVWSLLLG